MALLRFFKVPRHQKFNYKTRFYDPRKEELEERLKRADGVKNGDTEAMKARISEGFRGGGYHKVDTRFRARQVRRSNMVLIGVIAVLLLLAYLIFNIYLPDAAVLLNGEGQ